MEDGPMLDGDEFVGAEVLALANELLGDMTQRGTKNPFDQDLVDSRFYFEVYCQPWIECVRQLRLTLFGCADPPSGFTSDDPPTTLDDFRKHLASVTWFERQLAVLHGDIPTRFLEDEIVTRLDELKDNMNDLKLQLRLEAMGNPFGIPPSSVWRHVARSKPVIFHHVSSRVHIGTGTRSSATITISEPSAINPADLGWIGSQLARQPGIWDAHSPRRRRRIRQAGSTTESLICTWTALCLEMKHGLTARAALEAWNRHIDDPWLHLEVGGTTGEGEISYSKQKKKLRARMGDYLDLDHIQTLLPCIPSR